MTRYSDLLCWFFAEDNLDTAIQDSSGSYTRKVTSVDLNQELDAPSTLTLEIPLVKNYGDLEVVGNVIILSYTDYWFSKIHWISEGYEITNVTTSTRKGRGDVVIVEAKSLSQQLGRYNIWTPIADEQSYYTEVVLDIGDPGYALTTTSRPATVTRLTLDSNTHLSDGDELFIVDGTTLWKTAVADVDADGVNIDILPTIGASIGSGAIVFSTPPLATGSSAPTTINSASPIDAGEFDIVVDGTGGLAWAEDQLVLIRLDDSSTHMTTVAGVSGLTITLRDALPTSTSDGKQVVHATISQMWPASYNSLVSAAAANDTDVELTSITNPERWSQDDIARIELDGGGYFISPVSSVEGRTVTLSSTMPSAASIGNEAYRYHRTLTVLNDTGLYEGAYLQITQYDATLHHTVVESFTETDGRWKITMRDGLEKAVVPGAQVRILNYDTPATDNLSQWAGITSWAVSGATSTSTQTRHAPDGSTALQVLQSMATASNEHWREDIDASAGKPVKRIKWLPTSEASGVSNPVHFYAPRNETERLSYTTGADKADSAIMLGEIKAKRSYELYTRCYPSANSDHITLVACSDAAVTAVQAIGYLVVRDKDSLGTYEVPYVKNTSLESTIGIRSKTVDFPHISTETLSGAGMSSAADMMLYEAVNWLARHASVYTEIEVDNVLWNSGATPYVGQRVTLAHEGIHWNDWTESWSSPNSFLYIKSLTLTWTNDKIGPRYNFKLASSMDAPDNAVTGFGARIASIDARTRRTSQATVNPGQDRAVVITAPSGSGTVSGDYVPLATYNSHIAAYNAHIADDDAHQPLVTANAPIYLSGTQELSFATDGLGTSVNVSGQFVLVPGDGIYVDADGINLSTPGTLSAGTSNIASGNHTHAVTAYSDARGLSNSLIKTGTGSTAGSVALTRLAVGNLATLTSAAAVMQVTEDEDRTLLLRQKSGQTGDLLRLEYSTTTPMIVLTADGALQSGNPSFVSGTRGWEINAEGDAEFNNARIRGELRAAVFVADEMHATGGTNIIATATSVDKPVGSSDNVLPIINSTFTLNVKASHATGLNYFAVNDLLRVKPMGDVVNGGELALYDMFLEVESVGAKVAGTGDDPGYYPLTVRRRAGGETGYQIPAGSAVVKWAEVDGTGTADTNFTGLIVLTSDLGAEATPPRTPYIQVETHDNTQPGSNWSSASDYVKPRVRIGNLTGVNGVTGTQWGFIAGTDLSDGSTAAQRVLVSDQELTLQNIDLTIYNGSSPTVDITSSGTVKFGTDTGNSASTTFVHNADTGDVRFGAYAVNTPSLLWDNSEGQLILRNYNTPVITFDNDGSSYFSGVMTIGTDGEIRQGTGTAGTTGVWDTTWGTFTGLRIGRSSSIGRLATYSSGAVQVYLDTTGKLNAGAGTVVMDALGIAMKSSFSYTEGSATVASPGSLVFQNGSGTYMSSIFGIEDGSSGDGIAIAATGGSHILMTDTRGVKVYVGSGASSSFDVNFNASSEKRANILSDEMYTPGGMLIGSSFTSVSKGQLVLDADGDHDFNLLFLADTTDVAHGMTSIAGTQVYASLGKQNTANGGLQIQGLGEGVQAFRINSYGTGETTTTLTSSNATMVLNSGKASGTGVTALGSTANVLAVRNNETNVLIVKGNGDLRYDGTASAYDDYNDVSLLRAADLSLADRLDAAWEQTLQYNREALVDAGVLDESGWVSHRGLTRLMMGAVWQLHERIERLERNLLQ